MASLSSFRDADPRRLLKLGLACFAGLGHAGLVLVAAPATAQQLGSDPGAPAQEPADQAVEADPPQASEPADDPSPEPAEGDAPVVTVVPRSLDALIPPEAVADPEGWAAAGFRDPYAVAVESIANDAPLSLGIAPELQALIDATFADFALEVPEPLTPDPALDALAVLNAPVLDALPPLQETAVGSTLVLALPAADEAFPERADFIARFRSLSTVRELKGGEDSIPQIAARARADEALLGDILRTYGYYGGEVVRQLSGGRRSQENSEDDTADVANEPKVRFDILPGTRYRFGRVDLGGLSALAEPDASRLIAAFGIKPGDPLYADRIVERELELQVALGESGYPFARLDDPRLLIDHDRAEGDLTLDVQPGGQYAFGTVVSGDPRFLSSRHLQRIARFDAGDIYRQSLETDLRRAIIATGLVSSVTVTPRETRPPEQGQPGEVALDVAFERAPVRTIAGAIGYGTEDGYKLEGRWENRNLFPPEGALRLRGILGTREALAGIGVRRNNFLGRDQVLTVDLFASDITTEAVASRGFGLRGTFEMVSNLLFQKPVSWQVGGELLYTDERNRLLRVAPGAPQSRQIYLISGLFGSVTLDASDDLLDPSSGYRTTLFLAPELSQSEGTQSTYLRAQGDASFYQSVGSTVLAGRVRAATIQGAELDDIAPSRRLYAGGGASVRGYGFQGVGPRNAAGNPTGGTSLIEAALEARIETPLFDGAVEVVPFIDAGSVGRGSTPDLAEIRYGAGVGIRYKTTFGPIRVDVAAPLNPNAFDSPFVVYISLGQAF